MSVILTKERISVSFLNALLNPRALDIELNEDDTALRIGSAVDCLLTTPEEFSERFKVSDLNKPTGLMLEFIRNLPKGLQRHSQEDEYKEAYILSGYKIPLNRVINIFWSNDNNVNYYYFLTEDDDKVKLAQDEYARVCQAVDNILNTPWSIPYFLPAANTEILYQREILFDYEYKGTVYPCKSIIDGIVIDHTLKVIKPYDLKTTSRGTLNFKESCFRYGYFRQAAFYLIALYSKESPIRKYLDEGYSVEPFRFIVVDSRLNQPSPVVIWKTSDKTINMGLNGGIVGDTQYLGIHQLLEAYDWHKQTNIFNVPKYLYDIAGEFEI